MPRRITIFFVFVFLLFSALIVRSVYLQVLPNERLAKKNERQFKTVLNVEGRRGFILDRKGSELAASVVAYSLYADPKLIKNPSSVARKLAKVIPGSYREIRKKITRKNRRFVWLARRMDQDDRDKIHAWKIRGLGFIEEPRRVYPNQKLLSSVLGFVGSSGQGLGGLETRFESMLNGSGKSMKISRDARGRPLFVNGVLFNESPDGYNLQLTVDRELQYTLEKELRDAVKNYEAAGALGVILDVETSGVLAMASLPDFDPNRALKYPASYRRNRAVTDPFEPGSILKTITIAAAMREKVATPETKYFCENGSMKIGRRTIRESDSKHKFRWLTVQEILAKSSNIGTTKIAFELGDDQLRKSLIDFGFGEKASSDFPGESRGILPKLPWNKHLLSNISFGHGIAVTPLQVVNAYAAIANGGVLNEPYIVSRVTDSNDRLIQEYNTKPLRRLLSPEVSEDIMAMLETVTLKGGTGTSAQVAGYRVGGKTGTAQKVDYEKGGYLKGAYVTSFAGVVPLDRPKFAILVVIDQPEKAYYASEVAAPVFSRVAGFALRHFGIEPNHMIRTKSQAEKKTEDKNYRKLQAKAIDKIKEKSKASLWKKMPDLTGLSLREVMQEFREQGLEAEVYGQGQLSKSIPSRGESVPENTKVKLYFK